MVAYLLHLHRIADCGGATLQGFRPSRAPTTQVVGLPCAPSWDPRPRDIINIPSLHSAHDMLTSRILSHTYLLGGILKKCVNGQAAYPLSEQDGLKAQERRYTAYGKEKH